MVQTWYGAEQTCNANRLKELSLSTKNTTNQKKQEGYQSKQKPNVASVYSLT